MGTEKVKAQSTHDVVLERVAKVRQLRKEGKTLSEITQLTGWKKGTVSYYVYGQRSYFKKKAAASSPRKLRGVVSVLGATATNGTAKAGLKEWLEQYLASPNLQEIVRIIEKGEI